MKAFLKQLEAEGIFNRALDTNGVPYHSSVLQPLLPELTECECPLPSELVQVCAYTMNELVLPFSVSNQRERFQLIPNLS